jgi:hypothetical protein
VNAFWRESSASRLQSNRSRLSNKRQRASRVHGLRCFRRTCASVLQSQCCSPLSRRLQESTACSTYCSIVVNERFPGQSTSMVPIINVIIRTVNFLLTIVAMFLDCWGKRAILMIASGAPRMRNALPAFRADSVNRFQVLRFASRLQSELRRRTSLPASSPE